MFQNIIIHVCWICTLIISFSILWNVLLFTFHRYKIHDVRQPIRSRKFSISNALMCSSTSISHISNNVCCDSCALNGKKKIVIGLDSVQCLCRYIIETAKIRGDNDSFIMESSQYFSMLRSPQNYTLLLSDCVTLCCQTLRVVCHLWKFSRNTFTEFTE